MSYIISSLPDKQRGAALLAFMLVLILGSSYMLLQGINENLRRHLAPQQNAEVLQIAKDALLGYAVTYPDNVNEFEGPGYLPCPDLDGDGSSTGNCGFAGGTTIGRFPHRTLRLDKIEDSSGERLWYAISENFRYGPSKTVPMNSEGPEGTLAVDDVEDIVAVIIAPGPPLNNQAGRNDPVGVNDAANYLEDINANGDTNFTRRGACDDPEVPAAECFNDQIVYITRRELMTLVEKRVLGEAAQSIRNYKATHDAYPWLSEFRSPEVSDFKSMPGVNRGHVPYHWSAEEESQRIFITDMSVRWNFHAINGEIEAEGTVTEESLKNTEISDLFPYYSPLFIEDASCTWVAGEEDIESNEMVLCSGQLIVVNESCEPIPLGQACTGTCTRTIDYEIDYSGVTSIVPPDIANTRRRNVSWSDDMPLADEDYFLNRVLVEMVDTYQNHGSLDPGLCPIQFLSGETDRIGYGRLETGLNTEGEIHSLGIQYDLDVDAGELASWFVENQWHHVTYIAYVDLATEPLPGSDADADNICEPGVSCITIENDTFPNDDIRGIAMIAGSPVIKPMSGGGIQERPSSTLDDYFEYENAEDDDDVFRVSRWDPDFPGINDQIRVIERVED